MSYIEAKEKYECIKRELKDFKELEEMSDNYYLITKNILSKPGINRLQAYDRKTGKPLNVFILKDL